MTIAGGHSSGPVIVVGFGRSGTSLTMRLANLLGVSLGRDEDLIPPREDENPRGYFEPRWMLDLNDEILATLGSTWWEPLKAEPGWQRHPDLEPLRERARGLLAEKFDGQAMWGWKEPRTTLTLPFWRELVPVARYVICIRNPVDAISSIQRRPNPVLSIGDWGDLWLEYTARALIETQGCERLLLFHHELFDDTEGVIERLASLLQVEVPERGGNQWRRLVQTVEPSLNHHRTSAPDLAVAAAISASTRALYLALLASTAARGHSTGGRDDLGGLPSAIERVAADLWTERRQMTMYRRAAADRLELAHELEQAARDRLRALETTTAMLETAKAEVDLLRLTNDQLRTHAARRGDSGGLRGLGVHSAGRWLRIFNRDGPR